MQQPNELLTKRCDAWLESKKELIEATLAHFPEEIRPVTMQMLRTAFAAGASEAVTIVSESLRGHQNEIDSADPSTPDSQP